MDLDGKYKNVSKEDLVLMFREMITDTPEDKEEIEEVRKEIREEEKTKGTSAASDESEGVIPAIDQKIASWLQTELLRRAEIQKVVETDNQNATAGQN